MNSQLVNLSLAPSFIYSRLGIRLTKSEILNIGKGTNMLLRVGKGKSEHFFISIDAFLNHLSNVYEPPEVDTLKDKRRRDTSRRYSELNKSLMRNLFHFIYDLGLKYSGKFSDDPALLGARQALYDNIIDDLRNNSVIINSQKENTVFGDRALVKHLSSFFDESDLIEEELKDKGSSIKPRLDSNGNRASI